MNATVAEAVQALNSAVVGLLPPASGPQFTPEVLVNPVKSHPAGIGGYIGLNSDPVGEVHARRLKAQVVVRIKADSLAALGSTESAITNALVGANQALLRTQGIYRITRDTGFGQVLAAADGLDVAAGKDIRFDVDFEYRRLPTQAESVIDSVPLDLILNSSGRQPRSLFENDFSEDPLGRFNLFDDSSTNGGPGSWSHDAGGARVLQTSSIGGGSNAFNANKRGTYMVLQAGQVSALPDNFLLYAELGADSGGIGLVFNFQDVDNYFFFIMSQPTPYALIGKKQAGNFAFPDQGGQLNGSSYAPGEHRIRLVQQNGQIDVAIDQIPLLSARESVPPMAGSTGFLSRNSASARFHSLRWLAL